MIDAEKFHSPGMAPTMINEALEITGFSLPELSRKIGVSSEYLRQLRIGRAESMSYPLQVTIEALIKEYK